MISYYNVIDTYNMVKPLDLMSKDAGSYDPQFGAEVFHVRLVWVCRHLQDIISEALYAKDFMTNLF